MTNYCLLLVTNIIIILTLTLNLILILILNCTSFIIVIISDVYIISVIGVSRAN